MSHGEHLQSAHRAAHDTDGAEPHGGGEARPLVERCASSPARLHQLLGRVRGPLRQAVLVEAQRLHGAAFVRAAAARPAAEHAHDAHPAHAHDAHPAHAHDAHPAHAHDAHPAHPATKSQGPAAAPEVASAGPHIGDHGPQVVEVQRLLQAAGYYHANVGGNFGPQTDAALRSFQRDHGLGDDGVATASTMEALRTAAPTGVVTEAGGPSDGAEPPPAASGAGAAVSYGMSVLGAPYAAINPYRFGEVPWPGGSMVDIHDKVRGPFPAGTQVFDCSGFVVTCWKHAGVNLLAHSLGSSSNVVNHKGWLIPVSPDQLQPGDLIAYPGHIVMYIGNGQVIQSTPNGGVKISGASKYLAESGAVCRRVPA